jgi:hypothetical protein
MAEKRSWHQLRGETDVQYEMFTIWLGMLYEDPPAERTLPGVYERRHGKPPSSRLNSYYFQIKKNNRWEERASDYDNHRRRIVEEAEERGIARGVEREAENEAISVERMRIEMANFVDDVGPEIRQRIKDMLSDEDLDLSLTSLIQAQRVVLETVKLLDRGERDDTPAGYTEKELEELLGEWPPEEDS